MSTEKEFREGETATVKGAPESTKLVTDVPDTLTRKLEDIPVDAKNDKAKKAVSPLDLMGGISVRPYVDGDRENMGLEQYGFVLFPGTAQEEQLAAIERNGRVRYITGLDEFAPEVQNIDDPEKKAAVIKNIRTIVAEIEKRVATNVIADIEDPEFWNKVEVMKPDNIKFFSGISLRCTNEFQYLNPKNDIYDLIKLMAIEAGGFDIVAKSYEDAQSRAVPPKFYLDKEIDTVSTRTEYKKLRNKATGILDKMFNAHPKKLLYVTKVVDVYSAKYKNSTPIDTLYDQMDEWIHGEGAEKNKGRAAQLFINAAELDMETLKLKSIVKDASFYKFISPKPDGMIYHTKSSAMLGRTVADVVEYLKSPLHEDILNQVLAEVEYYWKQ
jgi:hypothetical protein